MIKRTLLCVVTSRCAGDVPEHKGIMSKRTLVQEYLINKE
jgi:hypothetical protein